ncbi:MAG: hypothetical protein CVT63_05160 [Candidatus Anoxymicrobium japonicum]|uniref:Uncharacterized protein n=1 Tax=Candidatus Anoxymicrobium japonicum TaxID=2013648 RepID=A0A2N3G5I7_9ACTN|nr:MAG: hypothetical protein CVT63_05160 [Candidatus Anoxymicrobium japonicum]
MIVAQAVEYEVSTGMSVGLFLVIMLLALAMYVFSAFCMMKMADRLGVENGWFAFVPFLNLWLLCKMGDRENSWFIIMLICQFCCGIVTAVMSIMILMDVAEKLGFERWWGILIIIPIFNFYVLYKLAFTEP